MKAIFLLLFACLLTFSCGKKGDGESDVVDEGPGDTTENSVVYTSTLNILSENENFSTLLEIVEKHNLQNAFESENPITFFAPTNEAFENISEYRLAGYMENAAKARYMLDSLIVEKELSTKDLMPLETLTTRAGTIVSVERANQYLWIEGKPITISNLRFRNGYVHGIQTL